MKILPRQADPQRQCAACTLRAQLAAPRRCAAIGVLHHYTHRGARTHDHKVKGLALYRLS